MWSQIHALLIISDFRFGCTCLYMYMLNQFQSLLSIGQRPNAALLCCTYCVTNWIIPRDKSTKILNSLCHVSMFQFAGWLVAIQIHKHFPKYNIDTSLCLHIPSQIVIKYLNHGAGTRIWSAFRQKKFLFEK